MKPLRFAIVGASSIAHKMMSAFRAADDAEVIAIVSKDKARADGFARQYGLSHSFDELDSMLDVDLIDAVYVANVNERHAETSIRALQSGKHVLCEKPFALNVDEGKQVLDEARAADRFFMEAMWTALLPSVRRVVQLLGDNTLGEPIALFTDFGLPAAQAQWPRLYEPKGGGVLLDRGVYPVSLALSLFGPVSGVSGALQRNKDGVDLHLQAQLNHRTGAVTQIATSMICALANRAEIACSHGSISMAAPVMGAENVAITRYDSQASRSADRDGWREKLTSLPLLRDLKSRFRRGEFHSYGANRYTPQITHFVRSVREGKAESDILAHSHSLAVLKVIDELRRL